METSSDTLATCCDTLATRSGILETISVTLGTDRDTLGARRGSVGISSKNMGASNDTLGTSSDSFGTSSRTVGPVVIPLEHMEPSEPVVIPWEPETCGSATMKTNRDTLRTSSGSHGTRSNVTPGNQ
jgi:hypothetical protein